MSTAIEEVLARKLIPWVQEWGMDRFVVAGSAMEQKGLPSGVTVSRVKLSGKRVAVKGRRQHGNTSFFLARWPEDSLVAARVPILFCVLSGKIDYQVGESVIHCGEGHFILVPAGVPYPGVKEVPQGLSGGKDVPDLMAFCAWDRNRQCRLKYGTTAHCFVSNVDTIQLLNILAAEAEARRDGYKLICKGLLEAFLEMLRRELKAGSSFHQEVSLGENPFAGDNADPIQQAQQYMRVHLSKPLTLEMMARVSLMSQASFTRRFRESTGQSFMEYLTACRLEEAKTLLRDTDWSISVIHDFIGLRDATRLRRIFRSQVGMTLSEYRQYARLQAGTPKAGKRSDKPEL